VIGLQREYAGKGLELPLLFRKRSTRAVDFVREALDEAFDKGGALRVLGYLGCLPRIMPTLQDARDSLDDLSEKGVDVSNQIMTTIARATDKRIVGHGDQYARPWDVLLKKPIGRTTRIGRTARSVRKLLRSSLPSSVR